MPEGWDRLPPKVQEILRNKGIDEHGVPGREERSPAPRQPSAPADTSPPDDAFARAYSELVARLFRPLRPADGLPEARLLAYEATLGVRLPSPLRTVYRLSGAFDLLHQEFHTLVLPEDLEAEDGYLPFYEENQAVVRWVLRCEDLCQDDPPVYEILVDGDGEQHLCHPHLSGFLLMMVYLQASEVGLPHVAVEEITPEVAEEVARQWPLLSDGGVPEEGLHIYGEGRQVICLYTASDGITMQAAAKTVKEFRDIARRIHVTLNEC